MAQGAGVQPVHVQSIEQGLAAAAAQRIVQPPAETAIVRVLAVAQRQHGVLQPAQVGVRCQQAPFETRRVVRRFPFAIGADDKQQPSRVGQRRRVQFVECAGSAADAGIGQLPGAALGQFPGLAALAGKGDQQVG